MKSKTYTKISELKEAKDFMRVLEKWDRLSERIEKNGHVPMVLPDLFWIANSGVGKTNLLRLLSEYLYECGTLMEFHGNVKYFEFMLDYCTPDRNFGEIHRMIDEVKNAAGFRNLYKGIISVDIEEWIGHCEEKHFISFLEYLSSNSEDWLIIFNVSGDAGRATDKLESILSMFFRLEKSVLSLPSTDVLVDYISEQLQIFGLNLDESARKLIFNAIEKMRQNKYFDGYKTLLILSQDIVYEVFSGEEAPNMEITADKLKRFSENSDYIRRTTWKVENKTKIGLTNRGNEI